MGIEKKYCQENLTFRYQLSIPVVRNSLEKLKSLGEERKNYLDSLLIWFKLHIVSEVLSLRTQVLESDRSGSNPGFPHLPALT